jgi:xylan 1,4-beta-xylosidase
MTGADNNAGSGHDAANTTARQDWESRIGVRGRTTTRSAPPVLPPPDGLTAEPGRGHVTLRWKPVPGAAGYLVHRSEHENGPFEPVDHGGGDVFSVPDTSYVDTTGEPGTRYFYAVATTSEVTVPGKVGDPVPAASLRSDGPAPVVDLIVDTTDHGTPLHRPWLPMIGSERLSQLRCTDTSGGRPIGTELLAALRRVRDEIGVGSVRAHAILHDDLGVYREVDGAPVHDFTGIDEIYDAIMAIGLRPVVEIGFMPHDLAADPTATVFQYRGIISPPKDWQRWRDLVTALVAHLVERYGLDEVRTWYFEVWNEANLEVFWSSDRAEWMRLYDETAFAVRAVDDQLRVGGPSSAAAGWVDDLLDHVADSGAPLDFVSTHTYGNAPLDLRPALERHGRPDAEILWTEWGVTPTHFNPVNDGASSAMFLLEGMRSAAGRLDALSYWVASDHFEELGRPPRLLHGGFGLITVGGIAKSRYHALSLLAKLGDTELPVRASGDGADGLVRGWATRRADGGHAVLVWDTTLDQSKAHGDPSLARTVSVTFGGLSAGRVTLTRLDRDHGDIATLADRLGIGDWPTDEQWTELRTADRLSAEDIESTVTDAGLTVRIDLPQPGAVLIELPA